MPTMPLLPGCKLFRYFNLQQIHLTTRPKSTSSDHRRQQQYTAFSDVIRCGAVHDLPGALDAYEHAWNTSGAYGKRGVPAQAPQPEMFTMKESLAFYRGTCLHHGHH